MSGVDLVTAEALYQLGPEARFELVDGELIEYPLHGGLHGSVLAQLTARVGLFVREDRLGTLYAGQVGHILRRDPDTVLAPDLSFIRKERDTDEGDGFLTVIPDFVVEVVEVYETPAWIERKVRTYLDVGVGQVWIVDPVMENVRVHQIDRNELIFASDDVLSSEELFPGFEMRVSDLLT